MAFQIVAVSVQAVAVAIAVGGCGVDLLVFHAIRKATEDPNHITTSHRGPKTVEEHLLISAWNGNVRDVQKYLDRGAKVSAVTPPQPLLEDDHHFSLPSNHTALQLAVLADRLEVAKLLLSRGAVPNMASFAGSSLLQVAAGNRNIDMVRLLCARGVSVPTRRPSYRDPVLTNALAGGGGLVQALAACGVSMNIHNDSGEAPLHVAVQRGDEQAVRALLGAGADPNVSGPIGFTPLHYASLNSYSSIRDVLLKGGADESIRNSHGLTPADVPFLNAVREEFVKVSEYIAPSGAWTKPYLGPTTIERLQKTPRGFIVTACHMIADGFPSAGYIERQVVIAIRIGGDDLYPCLSEVLSRRGDKALAIIYLNSRSDVLESIALEWAKHHQMEAVRVSGKPIVQWGSP